MSDATKRGKGLRTALFVCAILMILVAIALGLLHKTPWAIPLAEKERKNPLAVSEANIAAAKKIYSDQCANCHGDTGRGDGSDAMMYDPAPEDLTDAAKMNKKTDGEIYYQITEGRKPMPSFRKKLTEEQRWQLVLLVRAFAGSPPVPPPAVPAAQKPEPSRKAN